MFSPRAEKLSSRVVFFLVSRKTEQPGGVFFWRAENRGGLVLFYPEQKICSSNFLLQENSQICMQIG